MKKRICILTSVHPALDVRIFRKEALALVNASYDVTIIGQHDDDQVVDNVKIINLPAPKNRFQRIFLITIRLFILALKQKTHIYHFHDPELIPVALVLKLLTGRKVIYDAHEDYEKSILSKGWLPLLARKMISLVFNIFEKMSAKAFDYVIAATDSIANNFSGSLSISVRNYPVLGALSPVARQDRVPGSQFNLIYAGILTKARGISEIIRSLDLVNGDFEVKLKLFGAFPDGSFELEAKELEGFKKTEFFGWTSQSQVFKEMASADAGVVCFHPEPNHTHAWPNKLFEYMAMGLPVIASNFQLWRELVEKNKCGIVVDPLDPQDIARAIQWLADHPGEASKIGKNGARIAVNEYNWENESKRLLRVYEKILKSHHS